MGAAVKLTPQEYSQKIWSYSDTGRAPSLIILVGNSILELEPSVFGSTEPMAESHGLIWNCGPPDSPTGCSVAADELGRGKKRVDPHGAPRRDGPVGSAGSKDVAGINQRFLLSSIGKHLFSMSSVINHPVWSYVVSQLLNNQLLLSCMIN